MSKSRVQECFDEFVEELSNVEKQDVVESVQQKKKKKEVRIGTNLGDLLKGFLQEKNNGKR